MSTSPLQTFIIYARTDEAHKNELLRHLKGTLIASGDLRVWQDGNLLAGEDWEKSIKRNLEKSDLVLVLVSSDSLSSDFINTEELRMALEQRAAGRTTIVPIILRSCLWMSHPILRGLQGLPKNMKPVKSYADADEAWTEVLEGLERILLGIREKSESPKEKPPAPVPLPVTSDLAEETAWKMALRLDMEAAYRHYLEDFPTGSHVAEAKRRITALTAKVVTPKLEIPKQQPLIRDCPDCPEMVFVKGGTFMMGSEDGEDNEKPVHEVTLSDFYIGKYPVTFEEYDKFCQSTKRNKPNAEGWGRETRPVINVSWNDTNDYCDWLSKKTGQKYRLPTEREWEFAARGGNESKGFTFSGSDDPKEVGWFGSKVFGKTHFVGQNKPNEIGIFDMSGNVWEWCSDEWYEDYEEISKNKNVWTDSKNLDRVVRGGSYQDSAKYLRISSRNSFTFNFILKNVGFRLCRNFL